MQVPEPGQTIGWIGRAWDFISCHRTLKEINSRLERIEGGFKSPEYYLSQLELSERSLRAALELSERQRKDSDSRKDEYQIKLQENLKEIEGMKAMLKDIIGRNFELQKQVNLYRPLAERLADEAQKRRVVLENPFQRSLQGTSPLLGRCDVVRPNLNAVLSKSLADRLASADTVRKST